MQNKRCAPAGALVVRCPARLGLVKGLRCACRAGARFALDKPRRCGRWVCYGRWRCAPRQWRRAPVLGMVGVFVGADVVAVVGSRSGIPAGVVPVVSALVAGGRVVACGCCAGVDAAVLGCAPPEALRVFAAFGPDGSGAVGSLSAVGPVLAAAGAGASVRWWAGGGPLVPARPRLAARTRAVVTAAGAVVAFPSGPAPAPGAGGSGSWLAVGLALRAGLPVVVFPAAPGGAPLPDFWPGVGRLAWSPAGAGVWASGFRARVVPLLAPLPF